MAKKTIATVPNRSGAAVNVLEENYSGTLSWECTGCGELYNVIGRDIRKAAQAHADSCSFLPR